MTSSVVQPGAKAAFGLSSTALSNYITGHCGNDNHEGSRNLSPNGSLMPACRGKYEYRFVIVWCNCLCHELFSLLQDDDGDDALAGASTTIPDPSTAATVDYVPLPVVTDAGPIAANNSSLYKDMLDAGNLSPQLEKYVRVHVFEEDAASIDAVIEAQVGRRKRGSLEDNVEIVCRLWLDGKLPFEELTTQAVAMMIGGDPEPSQGAIHAVFMRWRDSVLADIGAKPVRFLSFSDAVMKFGIEMVVAKSNNEKAKRAKGFF